MAEYEFDPGFGPHLLTFQGTIEYLYLEINKFKNLSQKKIKFMQFHKKFLEVFYNNLGFYVGCLMWASYIKTQEEGEILNNVFLGGECNEEENTSSVDFMIKFLELFPKDMKYFLGQNFEFDKTDKEILELYKEFLVINKGFINAKNNTDIILPSGIKTTEAESFNDKIEKVLSTGDLSKLLEYKDLICQK